MTTIEVIRARPPELSRCRASSCARAIEWVRTVATGKRMPVDHPLLVVSVRDRAHQPPITVIESSTSHFATCPAAKQFRKHK